MSHTLLQLADIGMGIPVQYVDVLFGIDVAKEMPVRGLMPPTQNQWQCSLHQQRTDHFAEPPLILFKITRENQVSKVVRLLEKLGKSGKTRSIRGKPYEGLPDGIGREGCAAPSSVPPNTLVAGETE